MRHFWLGCYVTVITASGKCRGWLAKGSKLRERMLILLIKACGWRLVLFTATMQKRLGLASRSLKNRNAIAQANYQNLIAPGRRLDYIGIQQRREVLEAAATWGQDRDISAQLQACADRLAAAIAPLQQAGKPVIMAPLHMVSDIMAGIVAVKASARRVTAIVSSSVEIYSAQDRAQAGIDIDYCSIHDGNGSLAANLLKHIEEAAEGKRDMLIFPDITPDYTAHARGRKTPKLACTLFGRTGHLHEGVARIARAMSASVVFYYLWFDGKINIHIEAPVNARDVKTKLPEFIESAIRSRPQDWLLWHAHSLYFIND